MLRARAASRGIPVICSEEVGVLPHLLQHGAGLLWGDACPLDSLLSEIRRKRDEYFHACKAFTEAYSAEIQDKLLFEQFENRIILGHRTSR